MPDPITISIPGDKSISHRALLYAALAEGPSYLRGISRGADVLSTLGCLTALGIRHELDESGIRIYGQGLNGLSAPKEQLNCGNSGTSMRLLSGILAGQSFVSHLSGDASLQRRPMNRIFEPLRRMGATFSSTPAETAPFSIHGRRPLTHIEYVLPIASAQVKSAILLAGLFADGETIVRERIRTRDHTERMFGADVTPEGSEQRIAIRPRNVLVPIDVHIPGDPSASLFIIFTSVFAGRTVRLKNIGMNPSRIRFLELLRDHGMKIEEIDHVDDAPEPYADLLVHPVPLQEDMSLSEGVPELIDEIPMLAVGSALSGRGFDIRGAEELRHKESDRISLLVQNLRAIGCDVDEYEDGFASRRKNGLIGASIETGSDHRIAMAFGVAGVALHGMSIDDTSCADISFPGFWNVIKDLQTSTR